MTIWNVTTSYKYDLAGFCNLFTLADNILSLHREGYERFREMIEAREDFIQLGRQLHQTGFDPRVILVSIFDLVDEHPSCLQEIEGILHSPAFHQTLRDYYVLKTRLVTADVWEGVAAITPLLIEMAAYADNCGFREFWHEKCLPDIAKKCVEFSQQTHLYPVVERINALVGHEFRLPQQDLTLYLSKFSAPFGTSLWHQSFLSDMRWDLKKTVPIALHELLHPPFSRREIELLADELWADEFFKKAFEAQPKYTTYNTPLRFLEENLVEAAHVFLAHDMGLIEDPLRYFKEHDAGSHVLSPLIFEQLRKGIGREVRSYRDAIFLMKSEGILRPGKIEACYIALYDPSTR